MAVSIGKRKRQEDEDESGNSVEDEVAMRALFQRAFEAKFKPLERSNAALRETERNEETSDIEVEDESDWSGLSEDEELRETIHHDASQDSGHDVQRRERKAFMVSSRLPMLILQQD